MERAMNRQQMPIHMITLVIVILMASFLFVACNSQFSLFGGEGGDPAAQTGGDVEVHSDGESESESEMDGLDNVEDDISTVPIPACPTVANLGTLEFKHYLEWGMDGVGQWRIDVEGSYGVNIIQSIATYEPEDKVGIHNLPKESVPVTISVVEFRDCANAKATTYMDLEVQGTCIDGELKLYINEFYREGSVTIMCGDDHDKPLPITIPLAAMERPVEWTIALSELVLGEQEVSVPFMGAGLKGERTYTFGYTFTPQ
jgi:hypothetical protein